MKNNLMLIGEIAEFFGVSRKAVRLYEKKGIIKPVEVDAENGYRYYSAEQVQQLNALLELKALGFSLDEIKTVMDGERTKEQLLDVRCKKQQAWQEEQEAADRHDQPETGRDPKPVRRSPRKNLCPVSYTPNRADETKQMIVCSNLI